MATLQGTGRRDATRGRGVGLSGLCALAALSGCQMIGGFDDLPLPSETTRLLNTPQWACLTGSDPPQPTRNVVEFRFEVVSGGSRQPLSDVKVRACNQLDTNCTAPAVDYTPVVDGVATVSLRDDFRGYFEIVSNDFVQAVEGQTGPYVPEIVAFSQRELLRGVGPDAVRRRTLMFTPAEVNALLAAVGGTYTLDARSNGVLIATALDCLSQPAPGVTFGVASSGELAGPDSITFYNDARQIPAPGQTETSDVGTFAQTGLFPGLVTLSSDVNALGRPLSDDVSIVLRDNWATSVYVSP
ncbi:MAG TPA: hypothetical protein VFS43_32575 [Polyangiaceae bacterium]|nr:hypothetical protein [Polyangiaceae bacterium]